MVSVMKSPNMMSTTGRMPVMAAPTARPVKPASEIGVSRTRSFPNSSTRPESTLKGVPASATSSPIMQTVRSRRISSASASRIACANVSPRLEVPGLDVLVDLVRIRVRSRDCELDSFLHLTLDLGIPLVNGRRIRHLLFKQPLAMLLDWVPLGFPELLFLFRAVIFAVDVAHMMAVIAIGIAQKK